MNKEKVMNEVTLELAETTGINVRQVMQNNEEAINALSAFAQPIISFEVCQVPSERELKAAKRSKSARTITLLDLLALASVTGMAAAKLGVLDLVSLWT